MIVKIPYLRYKCQKCQKIFTELINVKVKKCPYCSSIEKKVDA